MTRLSRVVVPGLPHHLTQRGSRRLPVFFSFLDYGEYKSILADRARRHGMEIWTYCLMPNHVHLLAVPETPSGLARPIGEAHRRYALAINKRQGWSGHLWQERFASFPMSEAHLLAAARYVLLNPVRAGLAEKVLDWPHSSARAHLFGAPDPLVTTEPLAARIEDWASFLSAPDPDEAATIRLHSRTGRPLGSPAFVDLLERTLDRRLRPMKRGPRRKRTS